MKHDKWYRIYLPSIVLLSIIGWFYWFQWRPTQIKHDCSWVKWTKAMVPSRPAMTENEVKEKGLLEDCTLPTPKPNKISIEVEKFWADLNISPETCEQKNKRIIDELSRASEVIPAREGWNKSTDEEYKFCLRDKGL